MYSDPGNHMTANGVYFKDEEEEYKQHYCDACGCFFRHYDPNIIASQWGDGSLKKEFTYCDDCDINGELYQMRKEDILNDGFSRLIITTLNKTTWIR